MKMRNMNAYSLLQSELAEKCMGGMYVLFPRILMEAWNWHGLGRFGGSGTTATTFIYLLWAVLQRPAVTKKLQDELDSTFPPGGNQPNLVVRKDELNGVPHGFWFKEQTGNKLPYLQAVLNETFRMYPATIAVLPRTALADTTLGGFPVPPGVSFTLFNFGRIWWLTVP